LDNVIQFIGFFSLRQKTLQIIYRSQANIHLYIFVDPQNPG